MNKKLILAASLIVMLPSARLEASFWSKIKLACAYSIRTLTSPFRMLWNKLFGKPYRPLTVIPHNPVTFTDATRTVRIEGIETLRQTVADCGPRAAANCALMYNLLTRGLNPAASTDLTEEKLVNLALERIKLEISRPIEVADVSEDGVWYDEFQIAMALKRAQVSNPGEYAGPHDAKGIAFYDWEKKQFRLRSVEGNLIKSQEEAVAAMQQPGIHQVVICENAHYRALVIHRTVNSTTYYYADSIGASKPWKLPTFRTIFTTLEADHPEIVEQFFSI